MVSGSNADLGTTWNLCLKAWTDAECLSKYISLFLTRDQDRLFPQTKQRKVIYDSILDENARIKRNVNLQMLCPAGVDPLACYEGYFAYYIRVASQRKMVGRDEDEVLEAGIQQQLNVDGIAKRRPFLN
jgi:hypothetical protein